MGHLLLIVNVLIWASVSVADMCSHLPGYTVHGTSCFKRGKTANTWAAAEASCVADGGHLASIHSTEEATFVDDLVPNGGPWIGLTGTRPNMAWSDGTGVDYENWGGSEPDVQGVRCTRLRKHGSDSWTDKPCSQSYKYICRTDVHQTQAYFTKIPGGVPMDAAAVPASSHMVRSADECAVRCQGDAQCVHFILSEDGGKYLCETYISLVRPPTATPPTDNYQKDV